MKKFAMINYNEIGTEKINDFETTFTIKPLERGFANTLGNSLRRILLSSITGIAPFAIKIEGVNHEFQTLECVREDVVKIILNLKKVRFFFNHEMFDVDSIIKVTLDNVSGEINASDLTLPAGIELVNPDQYIAKSENKLRMEIFLTIGRGFYSFEENKVLIKNVSNKLDSKIQLGNIIAVDSNFSPIDRISFEVKELNTSSAIIQEELKLLIKTDSSIKAKDALSEASKILVAHLQIIGDVTNLDKNDIFSNEENSWEKQDNKSISIGQLELSVRSYNSLKRAGYNSLEEVAKLTRKELSEIKNLGKKSENEIISVLGKMKIKLEEGE